MYKLKEKGAVVKFLFVSLVTLFFFISVFSYQEAYSQIESDPQLEKELKPHHLGVKSPSNYGNIVLERYADRYSEIYLKKVVFPHWFHRVRFTCKVCHSDIGFTMQAGADDIKMDEIFEGKWCGKCHNGKVAFKPLNCSRCHSLGRKVVDNHKIEALLGELPGNEFGNRVDWVKAIEEGKVTPKASIDGKDKMVVFDRDITFEAKLPLPKPPDVIFPHKAHTEWLHCNNCHPAIFNMKAGGNPEVRMEKILTGQWCGVCHGKVAFPLTDCFRCHSIKEVPPYGIVIPAVENFESSE